MGGIERLVPPTNGIRDVVSSGMRRHGRRRKEQVAAKEAIENYCTASKSKYA